MLLDSNIIIYATQPQHLQLRQFIRVHTPATSVICHIEVLGYHQLTVPIRSGLERFFNSTLILPLTDPIVQQAIALRQQRRISLGDSIVAATALIHNRTLVTHNVSDFAWIPSLQILDPIANPVGP